MKQWEDIFKDKLEEYQSPLPDGALDRFHARMSQAASTKAAGNKKDWRIVLVATLAAAASAALFFLPKHADPYTGQTEPVVIAETAPFEPETDIQEAVAEATNPAEQLLATYTPVKHTKPATTGNQEQSQSNTTLPDTPCEATPDAELVPSDAIAKATPAETQPGAHSADTVQNTTAPGQIYISRIGDITEKIFIAGAGTALVAGLLTGGAPVGVGAAATPAHQNQYQKSPAHHFPARIGITASLPISQRWHFVTGAEYIIYSSDLNYKTTGPTHQIVQYIGVPLRADWTFASAGKMDFYAGGGLEGIFCLSATQSGTAIEKDTPSISLIGTCGIQYHITGLLGLYLEPVVGWTPFAPIQNTDTYAKHHPLSVTMSTGIRFNLDNKQ